MSQAVVVAVALAMSPSLSPLLIVEPVKSVAAAAAAVLSKPPAGLALSSLLLPLLPPAVPLTVVVGVLRCRVVAGVKLHPVAVGKLHHLLVAAADPFLLPR